MPSEAIRSKTCAWYGPSREVVGFTTVWKAETVRSGRITASQDTEMLDEAAATQKRERSAARAAPASMLRQ
jgi:hypothetical protein